MDDLHRQSTTGRGRRALRWLLAFLILALAATVVVLQSVQQERARAKNDLAQAADYRISQLEIGFGRGYSGDGWQLYFSEPSSTAERADYRGGIDSLLAVAIDNTRVSLDIAVFDLDNPTIADAIAAAHRRGVAVRIVTDDEHGLHNEESDLLRRLREAGVSIIDDGRSALMHNKFMILDGRTVWTGSMNYTINGAYRHNNNVIVLDDARAVAAYQAEFEEMYLRREFGRRSTDAGLQSFVLGTGEVSVIFGAEGDEISALLKEIASARHSIHFMAFVFSLDELALAMLRQMEEHDVPVRGIFERRSSLANWSAMPELYCAGAGVRQDGNTYYLHHKVIIIDEQTVITGSFNFSNSAVKSNDENLLIIRHREIAALYLDEWQRQWDSASRVLGGMVDCG
ncbi:MAG: phospholipase D-like domain-containing protein [Chloroflexi bacterium]|nr:phospholipase D-like domain-containing protein [Chloroflexota bacterium]